ncbi:ATP-binding protein [Streptomyces sp. TRM68367]|uniref:ATP-binding protein n=1 Tax=Streptomyces sp. TRM68367 TaxID=2758415 RepID=UPI0037DC9375
MQRSQVTNPLTRKWLRPLHWEEARCDESAAGTNAIAYGRSDEPWLVRVEWFREGTSLRVDVHNPGFPANVQLRHPDADDSHGRGLLLVDSLAESWHAAPSRFGGTVVSFVVADAWPGR